MQWKWHRDRWTGLASAVSDACSVEGLADLSKHPTVQFALAQIDAAERAVASIADEMLCKYHDGDED